jgi:hypothetical protein
MGSRANSSSGMDLRHGHERRGGRLIGIAAMSCQIRIYSKKISYFLFFGTLAPFFRASDNPIAIACFLLFTRPPFPALPDRKVPFFLRCTALFTDFRAALLDFAIGFHLASD